MLAQTVAVDFGPRGVRANVVCPGWVRTEMADAEMAEFGAIGGVSREAAYTEVTRWYPSGARPNPVKWRPRCCGCWAAGILRQRPGAHRRRRHHARRRRNGAI